MTTLLERKAGAAGVDPDDFNAVVDAVAVLGGSVLTRKAGAAAVDPDDFNALIDAAVILGSNLLPRKAGAGAVDPDDFNAVVDGVVGLQTPTGPWTQAETVTLTGVTLGDGFLNIAGVGLFSNTILNPDKLIKWANPSTDLATYSTLTFTADGTFAQSVGFCYDVTTGFIYQAFGGYDGAIDGHTDRWRLKVAKIDPTTLAWTTLLTDDFGDMNLVQGPGTPSIATDGTYLYLLTHTSASLGPETEMRKYLLSDGSAVGSPRTITGKNRGHALMYDPISGLLLFGGTSPTQHAWCGKMDTGLTTHTVVELAASAATCCDDIFVRDGYFWLEDEFSDRVWRVKISDLSFDTIAITCDGTLDGLYNDTDQVLLGIRATGTTASEIQSINPTTLVATPAYITTGSNVAKINEVLMISQSVMFVATSETNSKVARFSR